MKKIFISHSTRDEVGPYFVEYLESVGIARSRIFCSSNADTGIDATKAWFDVIFDEIRKSSTVILVVTPNYMRSAVSLLEAGAALGTKKNLIILAFPNVDTEELDRIFGVHQRIEFRMPSHREAFKKCMEDNILHKRADDALLFNDRYEEMMAVLARHTEADPCVAPIAMRRENAGIIKPCAEYGIKCLSLDNIDMSERIRAARRIRIITTTGAGFFRKYNINDYIKTVGRISETSGRKLQLEICGADFCEMPSSGGRFMYRCVQSHGEFDDPRMPLLKDVKAFRDGEQ